MNELLPRLIRLKDAASYLGMERRLFNQLVRPHVGEFRLGRRGIAFDRLDLDRWVEQNVERKLCSAAFNLREVTSWDNKTRQVSLNEANTGMLTSKSSDSEYEAVREQLRTKKRNTSSRSASKK